MRADPEKLEKPPSAASAIEPLIAARIEAEGPISVADFMDMALGHPEHGYYISRPSVGAEGDFVTAPEISQMFGEMIGAWLVDAWMQMGQPETVRLVELGPGRGTLMTDILRAAGSWPAFRAAVSLHLIETSPRLRQAQFEALKDYHPTWHDVLAEVPADAPCLIVANEFLDALPIHQFEKAGGRWMERRVAHDKAAGRFFFTLAQPGFDVAGVMPPNFLAAPDGSVFEISPATLTIAEQICARVEQGGAALLIDYGHVEPSLGDTLQAVSRHAYADPLAEPGLRDITAHVDFGTIKVLSQPRARVHGPVGQGAFLASLGIAARAEQLRARATDKQKKDILSALHRLTAASEMGALFKVMALTPLAGRLNVSGFGEEQK